MSAALQLPATWQSERPRAAWPENEDRGKEENAADLAAAEFATNESDEGPAVSLRFHRQHTARLLRRYLYASMQVGRVPSLLGVPVGRGWASSRPIRTFEDALIFVLDVEQCLSRLDWLDRELLCRVVLQEYTQAETAALLGMSARTISYRLPQAVDRLTERLLEAGLLVVPE
jgi:hypothetical protein